MDMNTTNIKRTRNGNSNRGTRPIVECFDCGEYSSQGGMVLVRRGTIVTFVHRAGTKCHKAD